MRFLLPVAVLALLLMSILQNDRHMTNMAIWLGGVTIIVFVLQCIVATRAQCPLCMTAVMASLKCSKHRNARKLLGSHGLRVAVAVLFRGSFFCPYCNEPSVLEVRERNRQSYRANSRS